MIYAIDFKKNRSTEIIYICRVVETNVQVKFPLKTFNHHGFIARSTETGNNKITPDNYRRIGECRRAGFGDSY